MWDLAWALALITVLLTFVGTYRFMRFFFPDSTMYPGLVASGLALGFVIFFPYITFAIGLAVLSAPFLVLYVKSGRFST